MKFAMYPVLPQNRLSTMLFALHWDFCCTNLAQKAV